MEKDILFDVTAIGELLIDFTQSGISQNGNPVFERNPGGAPANFLVALSKFGKRTAFMGKVGKDMFGDYLKSVLEFHGVDTRGLLQTTKYNTTLAFVQLDNSGDRSFSFYRNPGADLMIYPFEVNKEIIDKSRLLHFGSVSMTGSPAREATLEFAEYAKKTGKTVSYDPNLRTLLWQNEDEARKYIMEGMRYADILKISDDELYFLVGTGDIKQGARLLAKNFEIKLTVITMGPRGGYYFCNGYENEIPAPKVKTVDTTGAGDAFTAGMINKLLDFDLNLDKLSKEELDECIKFGVTTGSLSTRGKGGIPSMPSLEEVLERIG